MPRGNKLSARIVASTPDKAGGYFADGLSQFSHVSASRAATPKMARRPYRVHGRKHTLDELINETRARIRHIAAELRIEDNQERRNKLAENLEIKIMFLAKLRAEQDEASHG